MRKWREPQRISACQQRSWTYRYCHCRMRTLETFNWYIYRTLGEWQLKTHRQMSNIIGSTVYPMIMQKSASRKIHICTRTHTNHVFDAIAGHFRNICETIREYRNNHRLLLSADPCIKSMVNPFESMYPFRRFTLREHVELGELFRSNRTCTQLLIKMDADDPCIVKSIVEL